MNMPPVTKNLIIINLLFFLAKLVAVRYGVDLDNLLGLHFFLAPDRRVRQGYLEIAKREPERCVVLVGRGTPEEVSARVLKEVETWV